MNSTQNFKHRKVSFENKLWLFILYKNVFKVSPVAELVTYSNRYIIWKIPEIRIFLKPPNTYGAEIHILNTPNWTMKSLRMCFKKLDCCTKSWGICSWFGFREDLVLSLCLLVCANLYFKGTEMNFENSQFQD